MQHRPLKRAGHGAMDYLLAGLQLAAPTAFGLKVPAKYMSYFFGGTQLLVNALTDQPYAAKKALPFKAHGTIEASNIPLLAAAPVVLGLLGQKKERNFFIGVAAVLVTNYLATDWNAAPDKRNRPTTHVPSRLYDSERAKQFA